MMASNSLGNTRSAGTTEDAATSRPARPADSIVPTARSQSASQRARRSGDNASRPTRARQSGDRSMTAKPCSAAYVLHGLRSAQCSQAQPRSIGTPNVSASAQARPPTRLRASRTRTASPALASSRAAVRPAAPAPTTQASRRAIAALARSDLDQLEGLAARPLDHHRARVSELVGLLEEAHALAFELRDPGIEVGDSECDVVVDVPA